MHEHPTSRPASCSLGVLNELTSYQSLTCSERLVVSTVFSCLLLAHVLLLEVESAYFYYVYQLAFYD